MRHSGRHWLCLAKEKGDGGRSRREWPDQHRRATKGERRTPCSRHTSSHWTYTTDTSPLALPPTQIALPSRKSDGHQTATFHPLGAEDNLRMLASLGLLENRASSSRLTMNGSPTSASSDSSYSDNYFSSSHAGHYPNVEPYHRHNMSASSSSSMDLDPSTPANAHGPQCSSLPQLYICHEMDSALYARCVDCSHSWHVGPGQSLSYSP
jgi:hypothetical protein